MQMPLKDFPELVALVELLESKKCWLFITKEPVENFQVCAMLTSFGLAIPPDQRLRILMPPMDISLVYRNHPAKTKQIAFPALSFSFVEKAALPLDGLNIALKMFGFKERPTEEQDVIGMFETSSELEDVAALLEMFRHKDVNIDLGQQPSRN